jgi:hypothetical protein
MFPIHIPIGVVPPLPEGYTYENQRFIQQGIRMHIAHKNTIIAEVSHVVKYVPEFDDPVGVRYTARTTNYSRTELRPFNNPHPWLEYPSMETLVSTVLARHRLGVKG